MIAKFYIPLLEIVVAFTALFFLPEGLFRLLQRFSNLSENGLSKFIVENLKGYFFGTAVALTSFFVFGISPEAFFTNTVRQTTNSMREAMGLDALSICVKRAKEEFRYTPDTFSDAASRFSMLQSDTYSPQESLLAMGNMQLLLGMHNSAEDVFEAAYREHCRMKLNPPDFFR